MYLYASGDPGRYKGTRGKGSDTRHFVLAGLVTEPECAQKCGELAKELVNAHFPDPAVRPKKIHYNSLVT